jgi:hypothetical protein
MTAGLLDGGVMSRRGREEWRLGHTLAVDIFATGDCQPANHQRILSCELRFS